MANLPTAAAAALSLLLIIQLTNSLPIARKELGGAESIATTELHKLSARRRQAPAEGTPAETAPPYVMALFQTFPDEAVAQPAQHKFNTLRSFQNVHDVGCTASEFKFKFNLSSIKSEEDVSRAIFRVFINVPTPSERKVRFTLFNNRGGKEIRPQTEFNLTKSDFVKFAVGPQVHDWIKKNGQNVLQGFTVRVQFTDEDSSFDCSRDQLNLITSKDNATTQPLLVVYSYDHEEFKLLEKIEVLVNRQKRAVSSNTGNNGSISVRLSDGTGCRKSYLSISKADFESLFDSGTKIITPNWFNINVCGGVCEGSNHLHTSYSKLLQLLLASTKSNGQNYLSSESNYRKTCVPTAYESLNYIYTTVSNPSVITAYKAENLLAKECSCVYSYNS